MINITYAGKVTGRQYPVNKVFDLILEMSDNISLNIYSNNLKWNKFANLKWKNNNFFAKNYVEKNKLNSIYKDSSGFLVVLGYECTCFEMIIPSKLSELSKFNKPILVAGPLNSQVEIIVNKLNVAFFIDIQKPDIKVVSKFLNQINISTESKVKNNYKEVFESRSKIHSHYEDLIVKILK